MRELNLATMAGCSEAKLFSSPTSLDRLKALLSHLAFYSLVSCEEASSLQNEFLQAPL